VWAAIAVGAAMCAGAVGTASADEPTVRPVGADGALGNERLSDEHRLSRYAGAVTEQPVRRRPSGGAPKVGRLRYLNEDGGLEVYLVLESRVDDAGRTWLRIRLPMRPNGRTGWVRQGDLGQLHVVRTALRINRSTLKATLYRDGRRIWSSPVGVGAARSTSSPPAARCR
jgi:hypothetical protein